MAEQSIRQSSGEILCSYQKLHTTMTVGMSPGVLTVLTVKEETKKERNFSQILKPPVNHHQSNKMASFFAVDMEIMIFFRLIENLSSIFVSSNF